MIDLEDLYFEWLLSCLNPEGVTEEVAYLCDLLHNSEFTRRVGNDINRAIDGENLRKEFLTKFEDANFDPHVTNDLVAKECSWLEMLIALSRAIDYLYDGGVDGRFDELVTNLDLDRLAYYDPSRSEAQRYNDQLVVDDITRKVDNNMFERNGHGGIFPLHGVTHPDQRRVEIWDQAGAYFNERLEGVLWTSTN